MSYTARAVLGSFLAVSIFLWSFQDSIAADVSECGVLNSSGTTYVLQKDVISVGSCFFITAENVTLDLNGHTVTYDNGSPLSVPNGDFEISGSWDFSTAPGAAVVPGSFVKPVTLYSGARSLRFPVPSSDQSVKSTTPITLEPNTTYSLSAMFHNLSSDPVSLYVELQELGAKTVQTGKTWRGFQYSNIRFTTGASPSPVTIVAGITGGTAGSGYVYIDDIRIQRHKFAGVAVGPAAWQGQNVISDVTQFGNANNATVKNGIIVQGQGMSDFSNGITIMENSGVGWKMHDLTLRTHGANSKAIRSVNARNAELYNNYIYNPQRAITSRDAFDGAAVKVEYPGYGNRFYNNTVHEGVQTAFYLPQAAGQVVNEIFGNTIELQSRYTNDFGIVAGGAKIYGNTINCGSGNNSCRGIAIGGDGTKVFNNNVNVQQLARNQEYNGCEMAGAYGMQMEYTAKNVEVYGNTVTANAGVCEAYAFRANPDLATSVNNLVHDNTFTAIASGAGRAASIKYSAMNATAVNVYSNTFRTNHRWIFVDGGGPVVNPTFSDNRWETVDPLPSPFWPFEVYTWAGSYFSGVFHNNTYGPTDEQRFTSEFFRTANGAVDTNSSYLLTGDQDTDTIAPEVIVVSPTNGATVNGTIEVSITATDNIGVTRVELNLDGVLLATNAIIPYKFTVDTKNLINGSHIFTAKAYDAAGNVAQSMITVQINNDKTAPTITAFTVPATSNALIVPVSSFTASDNIQVNGYIITESSTAPLATATGWASAAPLSYTAATAGEHTLYAWARDAAGNVSVSKSATVTVTLPVETPEFFTIWPSTAVPTTVDSGPDDPVELGVKFRSDTGGIISGIRFYKSAANTGTHTARLWSASGTLLGTAGFTSETASGWQQADFPAPVAISANTVYIASYHTANGHYSFNQNYFSGTGTNAPPLHALADGDSGANGVYGYGPPGTFPSSGWFSSNYWIDVVFTASTSGDTIAPVVSTFTIPATSSTLSVPITSLIATDNTAVTEYLVTELSTAPLAVDSGWSVNAPTSYTFNSSGSKTLYAWARDAAGNVSTAKSASVTITLLVEAPETFTLWPSTAVPAVIDSGPDSAVQLGVKFQSDTSGYITGIRFYKAAANTGTHVGSLWSSSGTRLAVVTFTNETASGWQQANFSSPVAISANTVYIASYHTTVGHYSDNIGYFSGNGVDNPPLYAPADGVSGANSVYAYGPSTAFPNQTWQSVNYWVDVVFKK